MLRIQYSPSKPNIRKSQSESQKGKRILDSFRKKGHTLIIVPEPEFFPGEVEISGTVKDLHAFKARVLAFLQSGDTVMAVDADPAFDPRPHDRVIPRMEIAKTEGPTKISTDEKSVLRVDGAPENIRRFMSWFDVPEDAFPGWHGHYDNLDAGPYVAQDSLPTVVGVI
jgi:hypothetical protein